MRLRDFLLLVFLLFKFHISIGQVDENQWWYDKHNYDGITPLQNYIIYSPKYMGPNALPVSAIKNGLIPQNAYLNLGAQNHISKGDKTSNLYSEFYIPLFNSRVGLNLELVPVEHYKMDTLTRDARRVLSKNAEGFASGDLYIGTYIQLLEGKKKLPDILLTINLKTASGNKQLDARYTDTPGYSFDFSFGKTFNIDKQGKKNIRIYTMQGFYVWQIIGSYIYLQNDAYLYGYGMDLILPKLEIKNALGGFLGYIGNGDRPMVYRLTLKTRLDKVFNYEFKFQKGLHDFEYSSFMLSTNINLKKLGSRKNQ